MVSPRSLLQGFLVQKLLTTAIAMLVGSGGPPREAAVIFDEESVDVWAQSSLQRQQVLDSLFAKRLQRDRRESGQKDSQQQADAVRLPVITSYCHPPVRC